MKIKTHSVDLKPDLIVIAGKKKYYVFKFMGYYATVANFRDLDKGWSIFMTFENLLTRLEEESKQSDWDKIDIFVLGTTEMYKSGDLAQLELILSKFKE